MPVPCRAEDDASSARHGEMEEYSFMPDGCIAIAVYQPHAMNKVLLLLLEPDRTGEQAMVGSTLPVASIMPTSGWFAPSVPYTPAPAASGTHSPSPWPTPSQTPSAGAGAGSHEASVRSWARWVGVVAAVAVLAGSCLAIRSWGTKSPSASPSILYSRMHSDGDGEEGEDEDEEDCEEEDAGFGGRLRVTSAEWWPEEGWKGRGPEVELSTMHRTVVPFDAGSNPTPHMTEDVDVSVDNQYDN